jgi:hypothetical protein
MQEPYRLPHAHYRTRCRALQATSLASLVLLALLGRAKAGELDGLPPIPVDGTGQCPTPDAVWQELVTLFPPEDLTARLRSAEAAGAAIRVEDLGSAFRVSVLGNTRQYREEARDCRRRARTSALFAALVLDPTTLLDANAPPAAPPSPPPPPRPPSPPAPAVFPSTTPTLPEPVRPVLRVDGGPAVQIGLDGQTAVANWGAAFRLGMGRSRVVPVLGVGVFLPADTAIGGMRVRQWRLPADLSVRLELPLGAVDGYGEAGVAFSAIREQALDLMTSRAATGVAFGLRAALGARLARSRGVTPFALLQWDYLPDPPTVAVLPAGALGRTPRAWLGACAGVSWGVR